MQELIGQFVGFGFASLVAWHLLKQNQATMQELVLEIRSLKVQIYTICNLKNPLAQEEKKEPKEEKNAG